MRVLVAKPVFSAATEPGRLPVLRTPELVDNPDADWVVEHYDLADPLLRHHFGERPPIVFRPGPKLDDRNLFYWRTATGEAPRPGRPCRVDDGRIFDEQLEPIVAFRQVAVFQSHADRRPGFAHLSNPDAAEMIADHVLAYNRGRQPADQIRWIELRACMQSNPRFVLFGENNATALQRELDLACAARGQAPGTLKVLAAIDRGPLDGALNVKSWVPFRRKPTRLVPVECLPASPLRRASDSVVVNACAAAAAGLTVGIVARAVWSVVVPLLFG